MRQRERTVNMPKIKEIYDYIDSFAPFCIQDDFDNSGLCVGDMDDQNDIRRALLALDVTAEVVKEAQELDCGIIITHHPVIFHGMKHLDMGYPSAQALAAGIACIGCHTNLDSAPYGVSDMMVDRLEFKNLHVVPKINRKNPIDGSPVGYGALSQCQSMSPAELAALAKERFDSAALRWVDGGKEIDKVACGSGACSEILHDAYRLGAQALITGDVKLDVFLEAKRLGMTLIDAGHYETEAIALTYLAQKLNDSLDLDCIVSSKDRVVRGI